MEEQWKEFHTYRVSNYGRVINRYGRELHPIRNTTRGYQTLYYSLRWGGGKTHMSCVGARGEIVSLSKPELRNTDIRNTY